jgi:hypothetical protein
MNFRSALALLVSLPALCAPSLSLDQVLARHFQARGGLTRIKALTSLRVTRKSVGGWMDSTSVIEQKRPASYRYDNAMQGAVFSQAYDGKSAWLLSPWNAKKRPEPMTPEDTDQLAVQADLDGVLVDWKAKGHKVELAENEPVDGGDAYTLKVTLKNGDKVTIWLDLDSFLEIKRSHRRIVRGTEEEEETYSGEYAEVEGLFFPFFQEFGAKGSSRRSSVKVKKVELNPAIDDARFRMPVVKVDAALPIAR